MKSSTGPRIPYVEPDDAPDRVRTMYDEVMARWGTIPNFTKVLANVPAAMEGWRTMARGTRMKHQGADDDFLRLIQLAVVRTSSVNGGRYCLGHNLEISEQVGLSSTEIRAASDPQSDQSVLTELQRLVVRWAEAVTTLTAGDDQALFDEMASQFTSEQIAEITIVVCMWNFSNRFTEALDIPLEPVGERLVCGLADVDADRRLREHEVVPS